MTKFLVFDDDLNIQAVEERPRQPFQRHKRDWFIDNKVGVWAKVEVLTNAHEERMRVFMSLSNCAEYIKESNQAVMWLGTEIGDWNNKCIIALGASPKLLKWTMKAKGWPVVNVNISGMSDVSPDIKINEDLKAYLLRKFEKFPNATEYIVIDYADTGTSLVVMQGIIKSIKGENWPVKLFATGIGPKFKEANAKRTDDKITKVHGLKEMTGALRFQHLKKMVGRPKPKNPVTSWVPDPVEIIEEGKVSELMARETYNIFKSSVLASVKSEKPIHVLDEDSESSVTTGPDIHSHSLSDFLDDL